MEEHANNLILQGCVLYLLVKPVPRPRASSRRPVFRVVWVQHILDCLGSFRLFDSRFRIFGCSGGFHCGLPPSGFGFRGFRLFGDMQPTRAWKARGQSRPAVFPSPAATRGKPLSSRRGKILRQCMPDGCPRVARPLSDPLRLLSSIRGQLAVSEPLPDHPHQSSENSKDSRIVLAGRNISAIGRIATWTPPTTIDFRAWAGSEFGRSGFAGGRCSDSAESRPFSGRIAAS